MRSTSITLLWLTTLLFVGCSSDAPPTVDLRDAGAGDLDTSQLVRDVNGDVDTVDGSSSPDAPAAQPRRVVFIVSSLGIYHKKFRMDFPNTDVQAGFSRDFAESSVPFSPLLLPFASLSRQLVVVDGLTQHASLNPWVFGQSGGIDDFARLSVLNGQVPAPKPSVVSPTVVQLIAAAKSLENPMGPLVFGSGLPVSLNSLRYSEATAARRTLLKSDALSAATKTCIEGSPFTASASDAGSLSVSSLDFIATALKCKAASVAVFEVPEYVPMHPGNVHQDCADTLTDENDACFTAFNLWTANLVAGFAKRLQSVPEGETTMLDNTLVVWISTEGGPTHQPYPWNAVIVGGQSLGLRGGRYLRVPQTVPTEVGFSQPSGLRGASHNHLLVSLAQLMGLPIDRVGDSVFRQKTLAPIDATGPVLEL